MERFQILVENAKTHRIHRLQVEVTYRTNQVIRFTISAGGRYIKAEKLLFRKRGNWKLKERNFNTDERDTKVNARSMLLIIEAIEDHLAGPKRPYVHPKNVGPY